MTPPPPFAVVPYPEIEARYGLQLQDYGDRVCFAESQTADYIYGDPMLNTFAVYEGNTRLPSLDLTVLGVGLDQPQNRAVLVIGDLHVDGGIDMFGSDVGYPICLYVTGNITAAGIALCQYANLITRGNIQVSGTVLAVDASIGQLLCCGDLNAACIYQYRYPFDVRGTMSAASFVYHTRARMWKEDGELKEAGVEVGRIEARRIVTCIEPEIEVFDEMIALETGAIEWDDLDERERERIDALFERHKVLIPELQKPGARSEAARRMVLSGGNIVRHGLR